MKNDINLAMAVVDVMVTIELAFQFNPTVPKDFTVKRVSKRLKGRHGYTKINNVLKFFYTSNVPYKDYCAFMHRAGL